MATAKPGRAGSFRSSLQALRAAQKPATGTAAYSRLVNRPVARYVAAAAHTVEMTPNQATVTSATLSGAAIALLALLEPSWWSGLLISALLVLGYVMDSVDGQLARLSGGGSKAGEWLDHTVDCVKTLTIHLAVAVSWFRFPPMETDLILLVPLGYAVVVSVMFFGLILMPTLRPPGATTSTLRDHDAPEAWWRKYVLLPTDYGVLCLVFAIFGVAPLFSWLYTGLFVINALALVIGLRRWWKELTLIDRTSN